jgi:DNA polymerase delta subunit 1
LEKILVERAPGEACQYVKAVIADLLMNKLDLSLLVISKVGKREGVAGQLNAWKAAAPLESR